ncbi:MAG: histone deacetylase, partial [Betaproteobacteria bacterium]|nr:histone deacetylase [Betaproteobacteria bacterium]
FSIHGAKNYPFRREVASDLDIDMSDGSGDGEYLAALSEGLEKSFARARPELVIYLAGADPFEDDRLGRLKLTKQGLLERDRLVFDKCVSLNVPVAMAMAGGYARNIGDTVEIHANTILLAQDYCERISSARLAGVR